MIFDNASIKASTIRSRTEAIGMLELATETMLNHGLKRFLLEDEISEDLSRCVAGDVKYRFVLTDFNKPFKQNYIERLDFNKK